MGFEAGHKTIKTIFAGQKKFIIPRFQRQYSWDTPQLIELWRDLITSIRATKDGYGTTDYFIGTLVLIGNENSDVLQVVDGQQRLTTVTILISALVQKFKEVESPQAAKGLYKFIEGRDLEDKKYFKLENEISKPFLQVTIQNFDHGTLVPSQDEEKLLKKSYEFFNKKLHINTLKEEFKKFGLPHNEYNKMLEAVRDQLLNLGIIFVTEDSAEGAYDIFETLNARGLGLSSTDLVKNDLCRSMTGEHPEDTARRLWSQVSSNVSARSKDVKFTSFFRHFWLSNYEYRTENRIYRSYRDKSRKGEIVADDFLNHLVKESENYAKIIDPEFSDWSHMNGLSSYKSLKAISLFRVTQVRTFLMSVMFLLEKKIIGTTEVQKTFSLVENFHFVFSAICSMRPSGLEIKYSALARKTRQIETKADYKVILNELSEYYKYKIPEKAIYDENFKTLWFSRNKTKFSRLIKYIFAKIEINISGTTELDIENCSIEHILSESTNDQNERKVIGMMGNLILLDRTLNSEAGHLSLNKKIPIYKKSSLRQITSFIEFNNDKPCWTIADINKRQDDIATQTWIIWTVF